MKKHSLSDIGNNPKLIFSSFEKFKDKINDENFPIFCISEGLLGSIYFNELANLNILVTNLSMNIGNATEKEIATLIDTEVENREITQGLFIIAKNLNSNAEFLSKGFIEESQTFYENNASKDTNIHIQLASNELLQNIKDQGL